jgi:hypothetical protein
MRQNARSSLKLVLMLRACIQGGNVTKVVPRFVFELHPQQHMELLTDAQSQVIRLLAKECKNRKYDGMVRNPPLHGSVAQIAIQWLFEWAMALQAMI